ncbi:hypothetical protein O1611_g5357 [Lasiodiplodia mahajangana]|uniref:Uncharacterized protein n=1 Tax=Lasiodiplodia mahajangana TaxID=1108764 RepID=A0ACC2JM39_9PEZI|nr:hypothetical protein O1611_g5357 [Lasiodiplodia mahajangana]
MDTPNSYAQLQYPLYTMTGQVQVMAGWKLESLPPPAASLLRVLSVLDSNAIYEDVLTTGASKVALEHYPKTDVDYFDAREVLIKSSIVTWNIELGFLKIDGWVQDVFRRQFESSELQAVYNAAVVLVSDVWPFSDETNLNRADRLQKVQRHFPQVAKLRSVLEREGVGKLKPDIAVAALFNEVSWSHILQPRGKNLQSGAEFVALSLKLLEASRIKDENLHSKLLADTYRFQGITAFYMDDKKALASCNEWTRRLVQRINQYNSEVDKKMLPISHNEAGMALMRVSDTIAAMKSWAKSCKLLLEVTEPGDLPFPFPWVHRAIVSAYAGDPDAGYDLLFPILQAREAKLGKDDTETIETGYILSFMGNIRRLQGHFDEAYDYYRRGVSVLKVTTGEDSAATTQALYRLARSHYEHEKYLEASDLLRKCIAFAGDVPWYKAEAARATWKLGHTLQALKGRVNEEDARVLLGTAMRLHHELEPYDERGESELSDDDWDQLVYYYYR